MNPAASVILIFLLVISSLCVNTLAQLTKARPHPQPDKVHVNYVNECCSLQHDAYRLFNCVNASAEHSLQKGWSNRKSKAKIAIVSYASLDIAKYAAYSFAVNQAYSEHNEYIFRIADTTMSNYEPKDTRWNKVKILEQSLLTWASDADYIIWIDADLIILDFSMRIDLITSQSPKGQVWVCASVEQATNSNLMNSGFMILKNTKFVRTWLLPKWWNHNDRVAFNDQEVFDQIFMEYKDSKQLELKVVILEPDALNSDPPAAVRMKPTNQVLHLMGDSMSVRQKAFRIAYMDICRVSASSSSIVGNKIGNSDENDENEEEDAVDEEIDNHQHQQSAKEDNNSNKNKKLKHQLGLDQKILLAIILHDYRKDIDSLIQTFITRMISIPTSLQLDMLSSSSSSLSATEPNETVSVIPVTTTVVNDDNRVTASSSNSNSFKYDNYDNNINRGYNDFNQVTQLNSVIRRYCEGLDHIEATWPKLPSSSSSSLPRSSSASLSPIETFRQGKWTLLDEHLYQSNSDLMELLLSEQQQDTNDVNNHSNKHYHLSSPPTPTTATNTVVIKEVGMLGNHPDTADKLRQRLHELFVQNLQASEHMRQLKTKGTLYTLPTTEAERHERAMLIYVVLESASPVVKRRTLKRMEEMQSSPTSSAAKTKSKTTSKSNSKNLIEATSNNGRVTDEEIEESILLMENMLIYADELKSLVEPSKRGYVHHIRTDLYTDLHMLYKVRNPAITSSSIKQQTTAAGTIDSSSTNSNSNNNNNKKNKKSSPQKKLSNTDRSLEYLSQAVSEKDEEALLTGEHCLAKILVMMGDALCQQKQAFVTALDYFNRAIQISKKHLGGNHVSLGHYSYLAGQAHAAAGGGYCHRGIELLQQAITVFDFHIQQSQQHSLQQSHQSMHQDRERAKGLIEYCRGKLSSSSSGGGGGNSRRSSSKSNRKTMLSDRKTILSGDDDDDDDDEL